MTSILPPFNHPIEYLTIPDLDILRLISAGKTDREIALETHQSERTVRRRLQDICAKMGVQNRTEAACHAIRLGLIE